MPKPKLDYSTIINKINNSIKNSPRLTIPEIKKRLNNFSKEKSIMKIKDVPQLIEALKNI